MKGKLDLRVCFEASEGVRGRPLLLWLRFGGGRLSIDHPRATTNGTCASPSRTGRCGAPSRAPTPGSRWASPAASGCGCVPATREREVMFWFLLYLDDMGYLNPLRAADAARDGGGGAPAARAQQVSHQLRARDVREAEPARRVEFGER